MVVDVADLGQPGSGIGSILLRDSRSLEIKAWALSLRAYLDVYCTPSDLECTPTF